MRAGIVVVCLVAVGCSGAQTSKTNDMLPAQGTGGAAGRTESPAAASVPMTAGTMAPTVGPAGAAAQPTAGAAEAPQMGGNGGQAGTAPAIAGASGSQAGTGGAGASGSAAAAGGAVGAAGTGAIAPGDPCPVPVADGIPIHGAGCKQMWEGLVMTMGGRGLCSAAFISDHHLLSASHCYANDGPVRLQVSAPTWDNGMSHTFQANVKRSGSGLELDVSVIDLGKPVDWATPERRFVLHAGTVPASVDLHLYGFGDSGSSGGAGKLRGVPNRATLRVTDDGKGTLTGKAGNARICEGDSGGPALLEKTAPVLYGVNQGGDPPGGIGVGPCAAADWTIVLTNVTKYVSFIEQAVGKSCERKQVDGLDVAQCW